MTIDVYTATGTKKGTATLPASIFEAPINEGLMHQALVRQQSNRRQATAHTKSRGEVQGSTRKLFQQKGTGRARRGSIRSPLLRGGGKAFGSQKDRNYTKDMPRKMRRMALLSCLSLQAKNGAILGLEGYPDAIKTKDAATLFGKLPVELGRRILVVLPARQDSLALSVRNLPGVKTVQVPYLNPEDVLVSKHIIFLTDAIEKTEALFAAAAKPEAKKSAPAKKTTAKKAEADDSSSDA